MLIKKQNIAWQASNKQCCQIIGKQIENNFVVSTSFGAGWNSSIAKKIKNCDVDKISSNFKKQGIDVDFQGNKVVAWCCETVSSMFNMLNEKYNLKLKLPKGIYVEDFSKLNIDDKELSGLCNWIPSHVVENSQRVYPERSIFFNSNFSWDDINPISDSAYESGLWSSNHFLTLFNHEFGHVAHNANLVKKMKPDDMLERLELFTSNEYIHDYQRLYNKYISKISERATHNPLETVAEDIAKKMSNAIDENLQIKANPFKNTPYSKKTFKDFFRLNTKSSKADKVQQKIIRKTWNGKL